MEQAAQECYNFPPDTERAFEAISQQGMEEEGEIEEEKELIYEWNEEIRKDMRWNPFWHLLEQFFWCRIVAL